MKTEEQIFYKKVYIHSEKDLPKESKLLFFYNEIKHEGFDIAVNLLDKGCMSNLLTFEWYLLPVTLPSDEEIEEMLWEEINIPLSQKDKVFNTDDYKQYQETLYWMGWMRDNITAK